MKDEKRMVKKERFFWELGVLDTRMLFSFTYF
jgi:hypothetical protein